MPAAPPPGGKTSRQQQLEYYRGILARLPGTYQGSYAKYDGMTWAQLYMAVAAANPAADPKQLADAVLGIEAAQKLGQDISGEASGLGQFVGTAEKAAAQTNFAGGVPGLPQIAGAFGGLEAFFRALTDAGTWISLGWLLAGVILIIAGLRLWAGKGAVPAPPLPVPL